MNGRRTAGIVALVSLVVLLAVLLPLKALRNSPRPKVVIAVSSDPSSAPIFVAQAKGFFRDAGLDVSLLLFTTGKAALQAVHENKADFATIADTVLMFEAMEGRPISSIATIATSDRNHLVLALRERGISRREDLAGKRIGVTLRTSGEYFLFSLLLFSGILPEDAMIVNLLPQQMEQALARGEVDAVATWHPTAGRLQQAFGNRIVSFSDHSYLMTWNIVGKQEFLDGNPVIAEKVLRALIRGKNFIVGNSSESIAAVASLGGVEAELLRTLWLNYIFDIRLREVTLIILEGQARWAKSQYYPRMKGIPDFRQFLYVEGLRAVDPGAVTVMKEPRR